MEGTEQQECETEIPLLIAAFIVTFAIVPRGWWVFVLTVLLTSHVFRKECALVTQVNKTKIE